MKTKIYYLLLLVMFFLMSCGKSSITETRIIGRTVTHNIKEHTINGHDYIHMGHALTHSGTCRKCKAERDSIINIIIREINN